MGYWANGGGSSMKELLCLDCEHVWHDTDTGPCPECGCTDIEMSEDEDSGWFNGHHEGDMGIPE